MQNISLSFGLNVEIKGVMLLSSFFWTLNFFSGICKALVIFVFNICSGYFLSNKLFFSFLLRIG